MIQSVEHAEVINTDNPGQTEELSILTLPFYEQDNI